MNFHRNWIDKNANALSSNDFYTKEEMTNEVKEHFDFRCKYSNEGCSVVIDDKYTEQVLVQDHTNPLNENRSDRKIHLSVDTHAVAGSKVLFEDAFWLIVSNIKNVGDAYKSAQIQQCNYTLPFQLSDSTIFKYPCIISSKRLTAIGVKEGTVITTPDSQLHIGIPYDQYTAKLIENKRLFIDQFTDEPSVYKITKVDRIMHMDGIHGLLDITCYQDQVEKENGDRPDLLIANYIPDSPAPSGTCQISYSGSSQLKIGVSKTFTAVFKDSNGNVLTNIAPIWTVTKPTGYESYISYSTNGMNITINASNQKSMIGQTVGLKLSNSDGTETAELNIKVVSLVA